MDGSFYSTSKGPTCPGCATGKPPKAKVWPKPEEAMNNPQLAAVLDDTTPVAAPQPEKVVAVDPSSTLCSGKITSHAIGVEVVAQERKDEALDGVRNVGNGTDAKVFSSAANNEVETGSERGRGGERIYNTIHIVYLDCVWACVGFIT